jgi:hypothetical protein
MAQYPYDPNLSSLDPSDTGPPFCYVDVQAFARWAEHRRCGPDPGVLLAKALFGFDFDSRLTISRTRHEWIDDTCGMLGPALITLCLAVDDVNSHVDLSEKLTMDLVWFMARSSTILIWVDWDRQSRLDFTRALPVMSLCREVMQMTTRRLAMGKGLDQHVAESWLKTLSRALHDAENDTPLNRLARAELEQEGWPPSTPGSDGSWDEALFGLPDSGRNVGRGKLCSPPPPPLSEGHRPPSEDCEGWGVFGGRRVLTRPLDSRERDIPPLGR